MPNTIRTAKIKDLAQLLRLLNQLSPPGNKNHTDKKELKERLNQILTDSNYYLCVCGEHKKIIGTGMLLIQLNLSHHGKSTGHIENVVVDKDHREKGIGKKIVTHLIKKAKQKDCYKVILNCRKELIPFYEKCGLNETEEVQMRLDL